MAFQHHKKEPNTPFPSMDADNYIILFNMVVVNLHLTYFQSTILLVLNRRRKNCATVLYVLSQHFIIIFPSALLYNLQ